MVSQQAQRTDSDDGSNTSFGSGLSDAFSDAEVDRIFRALADATRRDIVRRTLTDEASVSELAHRYDMSFAAVRKHVNVLEEAGLVSNHRRGRERRIRGNPDAIRTAQSLLDGFERLWRGRIDRLDALLATDADTGATADSDAGLKDRDINNNDDDKAADAHD